MIGWPFGAFQPAGSVSFSERRTSHTFCCGELPANTTSGISAVRMTARIVCGEGTTSPQPFYAAGRLCSANPFQSLSGSRIEEAWEALSHIEQSLSAGSARDRGSHEVAEPFW